MNAGSRLFLCTGTFSISGELALVKCPALRSQTSSQKLIDKRLTPVPKNGVPEADTGLRIKYVSGAYPHSG